MPRDELMSSITSRRGSLARSEDALLASATRKLEKMLTGNSGNVEKMVALFEAKPTESFSSVTIGNKVDTGHVAELNFSIIRDGFIAKIGNVLSYAELNSWFRSLDKVKNQEC